MTRLSRSARTRREPCDRPPQPIRRPGRRRWQMPTKCRADDLRHFAADRVAPATGGRRRPPCGCAAPSTAVPRQRCRSLPSADADRDKIVVGDRRDPAWSSSTGTWRPCCTTRRRSAASEA